MDLPKKLQTIFMNRYAGEMTSEYFPTNNQRLVPPSTESQVIKTEAADLTPLAPFPLSFDENSDDSMQPPSNVQSNSSSWRENHSPIEPSKLGQECAADSEVDANCSFQSTLPMTSPGVNQPSPTIPQNNKLESFKESCQICGDTSIGFYWGAFVCEACKKFYSRSCKRSNGAYICTNRTNKNSCLIVKATRTSCPYCRFQKCLAIGMESPGKGLLDTHNIKQLTCRVCGSPSSGFNFGVLTCEGCKGFFRRRTQNGNCKPERLICQAGGNCPINMMSRSQCRACRLQKCLKVGMSKQASRIGRLPNNVRYARIMKNISAENMSQAEIDSSNLNGVSSRTLEVMPSSASQLEVPSAEYLRTPSLSYSSSPATHLNSLSPVCMTSPTTDYSTSSTAVYSMTRPSGYTCTLSPTSAPLDIVDTNPLYGNTRHSSNITHPFQSPLPAACNSSDSVHSDKVEHPMDLSINCPKPSALSTCQLPRSASLRIQQISSLFNTFREDYYQIITDEKMVVPGIPDPTFAQLVYDCFQGSLMLVVSFSKKLDGFMQLHLEDRILLTKCSIYRLLLLAASQRYDLETGKHYLFGWRSWEAAPSRLVSLYPEYEILVHHFDFFGKKLKEVACSDEELGLLAVLNTINEDNLGDIKDQQAVTRLYNEYMELLMLNTAGSHANPTKRMRELTTALGYCQQAAKEHAAAAKIVIEKYPSYAASAAQQVEIIPQLYKEMFSNTPWKHWDISG
ncbi:hypothetical protein EB796_001535 [Bugula neritina]|uniref:Nuclear receptor domain-containing protein n=1 Tax=Bugula neritina TaxID=10212 RepID=A0A7J7KPP6_BUGNE|nr:hypothetical protein EB796_001535 [Bugula neritina]